MMELIDRDPIFLEFFEEKYPEPRAELTTVWTGLRLPSADFDRTTTDKFILRR